MKTLYLNLDSRPDRRQQAEAEFKRVGLHVERVAAISVDNRPLAFNQSVLKAMTMAMGKDLLLFEDDVVFDDWIKNAGIKLANEGGDMMAFLRYYIPRDALTLHLGCNIFGADTTVWQMPTAHGTGLARLHNCWQSHATWYSAECVEFILNNLRPDVLDAENCIFDEWLRKNVLPIGRSYVMRPMIAYQRPGISDIWGGQQTNYTGVHAKGNEWLKLNT